MEKGDAAFVDLVLAGVNVGHAGIFIGDNSRTGGRKYVYAKGYSPWYLPPYPVTTGDDNQFKGVGGDQSNFWPAPSLACLTWYQRNNIVYAALAQRGVRYPTIGGDMCLGIFKAPYASFDWSHSADPYYYLNTPPRQETFGEVLRCDGLVEYAYECGMNNDGFFSPSYESSYKAACMAYSFIGLPIYNQLLGFYNVSSAISPVQLYERMSSWEGRIASPPAITNINISDGATISSQTNISCIISDTDFGSGVEQARFTWDIWGKDDCPWSSPNYIGLDNHQENVSGTYSATWNTVNVSNGRHLLFIEVWDQAGNWALYQQPVTVYNSTSPPPSTSHNPYPPTPLAPQLSPNSVCLNWRNNGDPDGDRVYLSWQVLRASDGAEAWIGPWIEGAENSGWHNLPAGSYNWRVRAKDEYGNESGYVWGTPFTIGDGGGSPALSITGATVNGLNVTLTWTSSNIQYVRIYCYVNGEQIIREFHPASDGHHTVTVPGANTYDFKLKGYDSAYNEIAETDLYPVGVGSNLTITGATVDGLDVHLTWTSSNVAYTRLYRYDNGDLDHYAYRWGFNPASEVSKGVSVPSAGTYVYKLKGYDSAYNELGESNLYTVVVGSGSLAITNVTVNGYDATIYWTSSNVHWVRIYCYNSDGVRIIREFQLASDGHHTVTLPGADTYQFKLKGYDSNYDLIPDTETSLYTVVVGPIVTITSAIANGLDITINWTYSSPVYWVRIYEYTYTSPGYIWRSGFNNASNRTKVIGAQSGPGVYILKIKGYDINYNELGASNYWIIVVGDFTFQPDMMLRLPLEGSFSGVNIYNNLSGQTKTQTVSASSTAIYLMNAKNTSNTVDRFHIFGDKEQPGWSVHYFDALVGGTDITEDITDSDGWQTTLAAGATVPLRIEVTPIATDSPGDNLSIDVTAISHSDNAKSDTVRTITLVNTLPVALPQSVQTSKNVALPIILTGSDADGDTLTYNVATSPTHGTLSGSVPSLVYTPTTEYIGADSFTFTVNDGTTTSLPATISITVSNTSPIAFPSNECTNVGVAKPVTLMGYDPDGDTLTYQVVNIPMHGVLAGILPNLTYTPNTNFEGSDFLTFKVNDGQTDSNIAAVSITVATTIPFHPADYNPDEPSSVTNDDWTISIGEVTHYASHWKSGQTWPRNPSPIEIAYVTNAGYLWRMGEHYQYEDGIAAPNCWVPDTSLQQASASSNRNLLLTARQVISSAKSSFSSRTYTPNTGIRVTIETRLAPSASAYAVQDQPPAGWVVSAISHGGSFDATSGLVKWGPFMDRTARTLSYIVTPLANATGIKTFTGLLSVDGYNVNIVGDRQLRRGNNRRSQSLAQGESLVSDNHRPVANSISLTTPMNQSVAGVLDASDPDGDPLTYQLLTNGDKGVMTVDAETGAFVYTPNNGVTGEDTITFHVSDGLLWSDPAVVLIIIYPPPKQVK